jgi:hypothetical protein
MMYKAIVAVCSEIRTKHSTQSEHRVELLNVKPGGTGFKTLTHKGPEPIVDKGRKVFRELVYKGTKNFVI